MSDKPVFRLLDIEVEEISLVDRAANKQRFLIVKRSDMNETAEEQESTEEEGAEGDESDDADDADESDDPDAGGDADDEESDAGEAAGGADSEVASAAVDALAKLTDIVEKLQKPGAHGAARKKVSEELRALAEALVKAAGGRKPPRRKPAPPPTDEEEEEDEEEIDKSSMAEVRAAFQRVQEMLASRGKRPSGGKSRKRTTKQAPPAEESATATKLDAILAQLGTLSSANKEQSVRLTRLEKHAGMPNSAAVGERTEAPDPTDDSFWSFDLNKPTERGSVDRSVSFFDDPA